MSEPNPQEYTAEESALVREAYGESYKLCESAEYVDFAAIILLAVKALLTESGPKDETFARALKKMIEKLVGEPGELIFFVDKDEKRLTAEVSPHVVLEESRRYYWSFDLVESLIPVAQQVVILETGLTLARDHFDGASDAAERAVETVKAEYPQQEDLKAVPIAVLGDAPIGFLMTEPPCLWEAALEQAKFFLADNVDASSNGAPKSGIRMM